MDTSMSIHSLLRGGHREHARAGQATLVGGHSVPTARSTGDPPWAAPATDPCGDCMASRACQPPEAHGQDMVFKSPQGGRRRMGNPEKPSVLRAPRRWRSPAFSRSLPSGAPPHPPCPAPGRAPTLSSHGQCRPRHGALHGAWSLGTRPSIPPGDTRL